MNDGEGFAGKVSVTSSQETKLTHRFCVTGNGCSRNRDRNAKCIQQFQESPSPYLRVFTKFFYVFVSGFLVRGMCKEWSVLGPDGGSHFEKAPSKGGLLEGIV